MNAFAERRPALYEAGGDDFNEREALDRLLEEVLSMSDAVTQHDVEGGPGMSSTYLIYYPSSAADITILLARFVAGKRIGA